MATASVSQTGLGSDPVMVVGNGNDFVAVIMGNYYVINPREARYWEPVGIIRTGS